MTTTAVASKALTVQDKMTEVEVIRPITPKDGAVMEEKKEDLPVVDDDDAAAAVLQRSNEEGQEALWVEESTPRSWKLPSPSIRFRSKKKQSHILLLLNEGKNTAVQLESNSPREITNAQTVLDPETQRVAMEKAQDARDLLEQAIQSKKKKERAAKALAAFQAALQARSIVYPTNDETNITQQESVQEAMQLGQSALERNEPGAAETAKQCLNAILPKELVPAVVGKAGPPGPIQTTRSSEDISTIGFDNTFELPSTRNNNKGKPMDVLSMSSLNEILDGPLEEDAPVNAKKKRLRIVNLFKRKVQAVKEKKQLQKKSKNEQEAHKEIQRFVAKVVDGSDEDEQDAADREALQHLRNMDERLDKALKDAMANDDNESVTSLEGVPLHGAEPKRSKKTDTEKPDQIIVKKAPRKFHDHQPQFVAAHRGAPHILTQKSWESLAEQGALDLPKEVPQTEVVQPAEAKSTKKSKKAKKHASQEASPAVAVDIDPEIETLPSQSPSSTSAARATIDDKYLINGEQEEGHDKYEVVNCDDDDENSGVWNPCSEICGFAGKDGQIENPCGDKYEPAPAAVSHDNDEVDRAAGEDEQSTVHVEKYSIDRTDKYAAADGAGSSAVVTPVQIKKGEVKGSEDSKETSASKRRFSRLFGRSQRQEDDSAAQLPDKNPTNLIIKKKVKSKSKEWVPKNDTPTEAESLSQSPSPALPKERSSPSRRFPLFQSLAASPQDQSATHTSPLIQDSGKSTSQPLKHVPASDFVQPHLPEEQIDSAPLEDQGEEDPLVEHIKQTAKQRKRRGMDPYTANETPSRGIDP